MSNQQQQQEPAAQQPPATSTPTAITPENIGRLSKAELIERVKQLLPQYLINSATMVSVDAPQSSNDDESVLNETCSPVFSQNAASTKGSPKSSIRKQYILPEMLRVTRSPITGSCTLLTGDSPAPSASPLVQVNNPHDDALSPASANNNNTSGSSNNSNSSAGASRHLPSSTPPRPQLHASHGACGSSSTTASSNPNNPNLYQSTNTSSTRTCSTSTDMTYSTPLGRTRGSDRNSSAVTVEDLNINQYSLLKTVGAGVAGKVKIAYDSVENCLVAIRKVGRVSTKVPQDTDIPHLAADVAPRCAGTHQAFLREVDIMKKLRHKHIVSVYEVIDDPDADTLYLVMQYIDNGPIAHIEVRNGTEKVCEPIPPLELASYARQMMSGLEYLHRHNVVHRDIKPDNILVNKNKRVFLSDFGVTALFAGEKLRSMRSQAKLKGTIWPHHAFLFAAPEVWDWNQQKDLNFKAVDMWAMGVTLYTLLTGRLPFFNLEEICGDTLPEIPTSYGAVWGRLLRGLLERDVTKRMRASDAHSAAVVLQAVTTTRARHKPQLSSPAYAFGEHSVSTHAGVAPTAQSSTPLANSNSQSHSRGGVESSTELSSSTDGLGGRTSSLAITDIASSINGNSELGKNTLRKQYHVSDVLVPREQQKQKQQRAQNEGSSVSGWDTTNRRPSDVNSDEHSLESTMSCGSLRVVDFGFGADTQGKTEEMSESVTSSTQVLNPFTASSFPQLHASEEEGKEEEVNKGSITADIASSSGCASSFARTVAMWGEGTISAPPSQIAARRSIKGGGSVVSSLFSSATASDVMTVAGSASARVGLPPLCTKTSGTGLGLKPPLSGQGPSPSATSSVTRIFAGGNSCDIEKRRKGSTVVLPGACVVVPACRQSLSLSLSDGEDLPLQTLHIQTSESLNGTISGTNCATPTGAGSPLFFNRFGNLVEPRKTSIDAFSRDTVSVMCPSHSDVIRTVSESVGYSDNLSNGIGGPQRAQSCDHSAEGEAVVANNGNEALKQLPHLPLPQKR